MMTFAEIGAEMGISPQCAAQHYRKALIKLKRRPFSLGIMLALADELQRHRLGRDGCGHRTPSA